MSCTANLVTFEHPQASCRNGSKRCSSTRHLTSKSGAIRIVAHLQAAPSHADSRMERERGMRRGMVVMEGIGEGEEEEEKQQSKHSQWLPSCGVALCCR